MATVTASASSTTYSRPGIELRENYEAVLAAGLDSVLREDLARPTEGSQFFAMQDMKKASYITQSHYGLGAVPQNEDEDDLPYDTGGLGFQWTLSSNTFRRAVRIAKNLIEDELYGVIKGRQQELVEALRLSKELIMADVFNRALGTSGAPFTWEDGMYFLDSARPNPFKEAGTWSNLESSSSITPSAIWTAQLNFAANLDQRGEKAPLRLQRIIIRQTDEKALWEILKSDLRPTDAMNARNFFNGRFEYTVYNMLDSAVVFYLAGDPKTDRNGLKFGNRVAPNIEKVETGNPDVIAHRIRARFGVGGGRPTIWRGGTVS